MSGKGLQHSADEYGEATDLFKTRLLSSCVFFYSSCKCEQSGFKDQLAKLV